MRSLQVQLSDIPSVIDKTFIQKIKTSTESDINGIQFEHAFYTLKHGDIKDFCCAGMNVIHGMSSYDYNSESITTSNDTNDQENFGQSGISYDSVVRRLEAQHTQ